MSKLHPFIIIENNKQEKETYRKQHMKRRKNCSLQFYNQLFFFSQQLFRCMSLQEFPCCDISFFELRFTIIRAVVLAQGFLNWGTFAYLKGYISG